MRAKNLGVVTFKLWGCSRLRP